MKKEPASHDLEKMLSTRAFDELPADDQKWVLEQMTVQEYQSQRWTLLAARDAFASEALPELPSADFLLQQYTSRKSASLSSPSWLHYFAGMRIPAWQLATALLFGWLIGFWGGNNNESALGMVVAPSYPADTIVKEIPVFVSVGAEKLAEITDSQTLKSWIEKHGLSNTAIIRGTDYFREKKNTAPAVILTGNHSSVADDKELLDLVVQLR